MLAAIGAVLLGGLALWGICVIPFYLGMGILWGQTDNPIIIWFAGLAVLGLIGLALVLCFFIGSAIAAAI